MIVGSHVVEINEDTIQLILEHTDHMIAPPPVELLEIYSRREARYFFPLYYRTMRGKVSDWTILPASFFTRTHTFDVDEARTKFTLYKRTKEL